MNKLYVGLFDLTIYLYFGKSEIKRYIKKSKKMGYKSHASGLGEVSGFILWVRYKNNESTLIHEISHLVDNIIDHYSLVGGEIRAFLLEFLYRSIILTKEKK